jgi:hypothetical protein
MQRRRRYPGIAAAGAASVLAFSPHALGWGHTGHVLIGEVAAAHLPAEIPAFVREADGTFFVGEVAAEPDISKGSGDAGTPTTDVHDAERDPGHFINMDDSGFVMPAPAFPQVDGLNIKNLLTPGETRRDFDTLLRNNGGALGVTQYSGYLPFNMVDNWQQIRKDFAYVRGFTAAIANPATAPADRDDFSRKLRIRQTLTLRDIGMWAHFMGDASQPMHVSIHYNGWGIGPNPNGYTLAPIHAPFEGYFVKHFVSGSDVAAKIGPYVSCETVTHLTHCPGIEPRVRVYLQQTLSQVAPLYDLTKRLGGDNPWKTAAPTAEQKAFVVSRLAAAAQEMRDELVDAWHSSDTIGVGYPAVAVADVESGKVVWTAKAFAAD